MAKATKKAASKKAATKKAAKKAAPKKAEKKTTAKAAGKKAASKGAGRKPNAAFMAPLKVSPALAEVVGNEPMPRTEIVKKMWDYIRKNGLQDQNNKRMINADDKLKPIFRGRDQISMFELAKAVNEQVEK